MYEGNTVQENALLQTVTNEAGALKTGNTYGGSVAFEPITYTQGDVGTKTYTIVEKDTGLPGYTYDNALFHIEVEIVDNDDGTVTATPNKIKKVVEEKTIEVEIEDLIFENTYTTTETEIDLTGTKNLTGAILSDGQFEFSFQQVTEDGIFVKDLGTIENVGTNITFPTLTYTQSNIGATYYYQIQEIDEGNHPGFTYDESVYTVAIEIVDNHDGTIRGEQTITKDGVEVTSILFQNEYNSTGSIQITGEKTLTGKNLPDKQFTFIMQEMDNLNGELIGEEIVTENDSLGNIIFPEILYTQEDNGKDFYYRISERNTGIGGYTYDSTAYTVHVSAEDNGDGTLTTNQTIISPENVDKISFENTYVSADTTGKITGKKELSNGTLRAEQFTFVLNECDSSGTVIDEIQRVTNDGSGNISFDEIKYTIEDTGKKYYYQVSEENDHQEDVSYDPAVYTVKIEVIDNNNGTISPRYTVTKWNGESRVEDMENIIFKNIYTKDQESMNSNQSNDQSNEKLDDRPNTETSNAGMTNVRTPDTGDNSPVLAYALTALLSLVGILLVIYKSKKASK